MADNLQILGKTYTNVAGIKAVNSNGDTLTFVKGEGGGGITPSGTMSITENGTYDVTNYASADVNVSGGGLDVGDSEPKANLLAMLKGIFGGTAKTGTFTLAQTIPNAPTQIFNANDSMVKNFVIIEQDYEPKYTWGGNNRTQLVVWLYSDTNNVRQLFSVADTIGSGASGLTIASVKGNADISVESGTEWFIDAHWTFANGVLTCLGENDSDTGGWTPFRSGVTYRWIAW